MYLSEKGDEDTLMIVAQINSSSTRYDVTHTNQNLVLNGLLITCIKVFIESIDHAMNIYLIMLTIPCNV